MLYMEADASRHAMEATDESGIKGTIEVSIAVHPPRAWGVKVVLKASKRKPRTTSVVALLAIEKMSARKSMLIWKKVNQVELAQKVGRDHTMLKF